MGSDKNRPGVRERKPQKPIQHTGNSRPPRERQTIRSDGADSALKKELLLTEAEVTRQLQLSPLTLREWRCLRTHSLPFVKIGKVIRCRQSDVLRLIDSCVVVPLTLEAP
jgi:hypothetical protein